jgi:hypothetical protein
MINIIHQIRHHAITQTCFADIESLFSVGRWNAVVLRACLQSEDQAELMRACLDSEEQAELDRQQAAAERNAGEQPPRAMHCSRAVYESRMRRARAAG